MHRNMAVCLLTGLIAVSAQAIDTVWVRTYHHYSEDRPYAMTVDGSGNVYLAGFRVGPGTGWDFLCIKYRPNGDTAWVRSYEGQDAKLWAVAVDPAGNVYAGGFSNFVGEFDYTTVKYDPNGNQLWLRRYERQPQSNDLLSALCVDDSSYCYVTGDCYDGPEPVDGAVIKYKPNGDTAWVRHGPGPRNQNVAIAVDATGNVYVTGTCIVDRDRPWTSGFWTAKYRPNGDTAWVRRWFGPLNRAGANALALDSSGVVVVGWCYDANYNYDWGVIKYSLAGDSLWADVVNEPWDNYEECRRVALDSLGNAFVTGTASSGTSSFIMTAKYDTHGNREWFVIHGDTTSYPADVPTGIVTDAAGNCYICGPSISDAHGSSILTLKYGPDGREVWHAYYRPPDDGADACGLGLSGPDYVYVAGAGLYPGRYWDCVTIKYDQTLGIAVAGTALPASRPGPTIFRRSLNLPSAGCQRQASIALLNLSGRCVLRLRPGHNDVSHLAPGIYFVRTDQSQLYRVVITK